MNKHQRGFTIVELMIAISVLSVILLLVSVGIIQISKTYYKGIVQSNTQHANRALLQDIAESIEFGSFSNLVIPVPSDLTLSYPTNFKVRSICFGTRRYSYIPLYQLNSSKATSGDPTAGNSRHVLWKDTDLGGVCAPVDVGQISPPASTGGRELLSEHMRVTQLSVKLANSCSPLPSLGCSDSLYKISVTVMYGDDDLIDSSDPNPAKWTCKPSGSAFAAAFCAKSDLSTVIGKRLS